MYMYHCPAYHFYEMCIPLVNEPIRSYQIQSLKNLLVSIAYYSEFKNDIVVSPPAFV